MITPIQGCLFIELLGQYNNISSSQEKYGNSKSRGKVIDIALNVVSDALELGIKKRSTVYFNQYEDQSAFKRDGKDFAFIKLEDIRGVEND
jgi:co-chaperonin GroES (HSP10)